MQNQTFFDFLSKNCSFCFPARKNCQRMLTKAFGNDIIDVTYKSHPRILHPQRIFYKIIKEVIFK